MESNPTFHFDLQQGTDEWQQIRLGKITGTSIQPLLVAGKGAGGFGTGAFTEMYRIIHERVTGELYDSFAGNQYTEFGNENEYEASLYYDEINFTSLQSIGFVSLNEWVGCSPDRLLPDIKKGVEIKCLPKEHARIFDTKECIDKHYFQCQFCLYVTKYDSWDLVYFHPDYPVKSKMVTFEIMPNLELHTTFQDRIEAFKLLCETKIDQYK